jgi:hypothetical protein
MQGRVIERVQTKHKHTLLRLEYVPFRELQGGAEHCYQRAHAVINTRKRARPSSEVSEDACDEDSVSLVTVFYPINSQRKWEDMEGRSGYARGDNNDHFREI